MIYSQSINRNINKSNGNIKYVILILFIVAIGLFFFLRNNNKTVDNNNVTTTPEETSTPIINSESRVLITRDELNSVEYLVEVADSDEERENGLMYRESLDENRGMIFVFDHNYQGAFWMKNCLIPLDMLFINDNNEIVDIIEYAVPCSEEDCPLYGGNTEYKYVLEVNGGQVSKKDIKIGDNVLIDL